MTPAGKGLAKRYDLLRTACTRLDRARPGSGEPWRQAADEALAAVLAEMAGAVGPLAASPPCRGAARDLASRNSQALSACARLGRVDPAAAARLTAGAAQALDQVTARMLAEVPEPRSAGGGRVPAPVCSSGLGQGYATFRSTAARLDRLRPGAGDPWRREAEGVFVVLLADLASAYASSIAPGRVYTRTGARCTCPASPSPGNPRQ